MQEIVSCVLSTPCQEQPNGPQLLSENVHHPGLPSLGVTPDLLTLHHRRKHHCPRQQSRDARIKVPLAGLFAAGPKTYEFRLPTFLTWIASFQDPYLISRWFMGSQRTRKRNARLPPSLIYAGIPLGFPRGEIPGPIEGIRFKDDSLNHC
jgi:hypothetical protein